MPQLPTRIWKPHFNGWLLLPSAVSGASMGLFTYGEWLRNLVSIGDEQMLLLVGVISLLATAAYFALINWMRPHFGGLTTTQRTGFILASLPIAAFLLYGGTSGWTSSAQYLDLLLPDHSLRLSVLPAESAQGSALSWFNTSLGDVSYATIGLQGWKRAGDQLVVQDGASNLLTWRGEVGDRVQIVLRGGGPAAQAVISWDDQVQTIALSKDKTTYSRPFDVPFYASQAMIMVLGLIALYAAVLGLCVLVWLHREDLVEAVRRSFGEAARALGPTDFVLMAAGLIIAAALRVFNLGSLFPAVDEYYHLIAAKQILHGAALDSVYPRGLWIVTLPVASALKLFGYQVWAARLVGAIFNTLAIVPLYLLTRKINRPVAALACLLYATSPWIVTFARVAREYAYYPFYFYWIIYVMVVLVEAIPQGFVFRKQWKLLLAPKVLLLALSLALPPIFGLKIDWLSTFRTILIAYLVLGLFLLLRFDWRARANWPILGLLGAAVIVTGGSWYLEQRSKLLLVPRLNLLPIEYFLPNPQQQWYLDRLVMLVVLGILLVMAAAWLSRRVNFVPLFTLTLFLGYLAVFALFSKAFFHTRHLLTTELWYVIVVAMALYLLWVAVLRIGPTLRQPAQIGLAAVLGLAAFNFGQILLPTISTNPDMPISEDYMHDMTQIQSYMLASAKPGDVLISTVYGQYAIWAGQPGFAAQMRITSQTPVPNILAYAAKYPSGWIVVDDIRYRLASLSVRDLAGHEQIVYVGEFGDERVWHWARDAALARTAISTEGVR